jgi:hypothetical protein
VSATIAKTVKHESAFEVRPASHARWFYVWMAGASLIVAVVGFAPTYWLQLAPGTFAGTPLVHLHGALFTAWPLYLLLQATFAARRRLDRHRAWGLFGISLATAMVLVGLAIANDALLARLAAGYGDRARAFHIVSASMIALFGIFVLAAVALVGRPEVHKRLMVLATIAILPPAIARVMFALTVGMGPGLRPSLGPPRTVESVLASAFIADALILAGIMYDMRTRARPHPAYLIGGGSMLAVQILRVPVSTTEWWYAIADFLAQFSG